MDSLTTSGVLVRFLERVFVGHRFFLSRFLRLLDVRLPHLQHLRGCRLNIVVAVVIDSLVVFVNFFVYVVVFDDVFWLLGRARLRSTKKCRRIPGCQRWSLAFLRIRPMVRQQWIIFLFLFFFFLLLFFLLLSFVASEGSWWRREMRWCDENHQLRKQSVLARFWTVIEGEGMTKVAICTFCPAIRLASHLSSMHPSTHLSVNSAVRASPHPSALC